MHYQIRLYSAVLFALLLLVAAVPSEASVLGVYSDRPTWSGLTTGRVDIDFESLGLAPGGYSNHSAGLTIGAATFYGNQHGSPFLWATNPNGGGDDFGSDTMLRGPYYYPNSYLLISFSSMVTSFGLDLMTSMSSGQSFEIFLDGVSAGVYATASNPTRTFFGIRTDTPIAQIRIDLVSGTLTQTTGLFDNVAIGLASLGGGGDPPPGETPEVSTVIYTGIGLSLLAWSRRRHPGQRPTAVVG
jgi:hypothetical protein